MIGDEFLKLENFEEAEKIYLEILDENPENEKVISNLALISLQYLDYDKTLNYCTNIMKIIKLLKEKINLKKYDTSFEVKYLN